MALLKTENVVKNMPRNINPPNTSTYFIKYPRSLMKNPGHFHMTNTIFAMIVPNITAAITDMHFSLPLVSPVLSS